MYCKNGFRTGLKPVYAVFAAIQLAAVPAALATSQATAGNARFTVFTDRMIRCEWSADGKFEDRPTLVFVNRDMPDVEYSFERKGGGAVLKTARTTLEWTGGAFDKNNLFANGIAVLSEDTGNLLGTQRTLDGKKSLDDTLATMEKGLLSRRGVTVVDDTKTPLFVDTPSRWGKWVAEREGGGAGYRDLTVFAYGHDYKGCLGDYVKVAGRIPLPPRWAFGYWWSRYWLYTDAEVRDLVDEIQSVGCPIDVFVIDMEWHETWNIGDRPDCYDEFGEMWGWTGYTWNRRLFPNPESTLGYLHDRKCKVALNLHPASGITPVEDCYGAFCRDYGWKGTNAIPFRAEEERWAEVFFKDVIEPLEADGADFFWLDWQQRLMSKGMPTLSNTFWLNHLFATHDASRRGGEKRPIIYHRWGGLGSHRYQIGFSGDGKVSWGMLEAIPWFTSSASNVGYGYWGHDLGGHMKPEGEDGANGELYTRWMQTGVFTPIFRTHTTKDRRLERRIWKFADHFLTLREAFRMRYRLGPYIYTAAREAYDTGVSMCRPMYYDWPETEAAYAVTNAYMFGNDILTATVSNPVDEITQEAEIDVWFPEGTWYDVSKGELVEAGNGGRMMRRGYMVEEHPWFVKGGAVIPMYPDSVKRLGNPGTDDLVLFCAPYKTSVHVEQVEHANHLHDLHVLHGQQKGAAVSTSLYEDGGDNADYATNFRRTAIRREGTASSSDRVRASTR